MEVYNLQKKRVKLVFSGNGLDLWKRWEEIATWMHLCFLLIMTAMSLSDSSLNKVLSI